MEQNGAKVIIRRRRLRLRKRKKGGKVMITM
jgi:hypothetical protein